jgi:acetyl/propionyl-CoA carboxylase alpha subunit
MGHWGWNNAMRILEEYDFLEIVSDDCSRVVAKVVHPRYGFLPEDE